MTPGHRHHPQRPDRLRGQSRCRQPVTPIDHRHQHPRGRRSRSAANSLGHRHHPERADRLRGTNDTGNSVTPVDIATNTAGTPITVGSRARTASPSPRTARPPTSRTTSAAIRDPDRHWPPTPRDRRSPSGPDPMASPSPPTRPRRPPSPPPRGPRATPPPSTPRPRAPRSARSPATPGTSVTGRRRPPPRPPPPTPTPPRAPTR